MIYFLKRLILLFVAGVILTSCYQAHSDDDLRTVPVTNNPHIVPQNGGNPLSMMGM